MAIRRNAYASVLAAVMALACNGQDELPRRVFLGIRMEAVTEDMRRVMGLGDVPGVLVSEVLPSSTASAAGWVRGDLLTSLGGEPVNSVGEVLDRLAGRRAGTPIAYELMRQGKRHKGTARLTAWAEERPAGLEMRYGAVRTVNGLQRTILARPSGRGDERLPLVVFIGGIACYSLDTPMDTARSETRLLNDLARKGYACVRLEKPGMGDGGGFGKSCAEVGLMDEMLGYVDMVKALKRSPGVDSTEITIIGHSMGGVFAPLVAQRTPVQRIIAYGTIGSNFMEYLLKTRRTIGEAYGWEPERTDIFIKDYCECATWYFADGMSTEAVEAKKPGCGELVGIFDSRSRKYNDELYALNIPAAWRGYRGRTLLLWGEADYIAARHDHEILRDILQQQRPGSVNFQVVPDADHGMHQADDPQAAVAGSGPYQPGVGRIITDWLDADP